MFQCRCASVRPASPTETQAHTDSPAAESNEETQVYTENPTTASNEDDTCFVCFEGGAPRSQCLCVNSHVHDACLERWLQQSGKTECSVCRAPYRNVDANKELREWRINWSVLMMLVVFVAVAALAFCGSYVLFEYFCEQANALILIPGIAFLALIPLLLWHSRISARSAWMAGCKVISFVAHVQPKVVKLPVASARSDAVYTC